jgi:hypothetical protein
MDTRAEGESKPNFRRMSAVGYEEGRQLLHVQGGNLCKRGCSFGAVRPPIIIGFLDDYQPKSETTRRIMQDPFSLAIWNKV